jgi:hypothetical protein
MNWSRLMRWHRRNRRGERLWKRPGPKKKPLENPALLRQRLRGLRHGPCRSRDLPEVYKKYHEQISRRDLRVMSREIRLEINREIEIRLREVRACLREHGVWQTEWAWALGEGVVQDLNHRNRPCLEGRTSLQVFEFGKELTEEYDDDKGKEHNRNLVTRSRTDRGHATSICVARFSKFLVSKMTWRYKVL